MYDSLPAADTAQAASSLCPSPSPLADIRILIVLSSLELGGAERQALLLARYLKQEHGARVHVLGFGAGGRAADRCTELGIPWRGFPLPPSGARLQQIFGLARLIGELRRARPAIILPYTANPNAWCGLLWRWSGAHTCIWNQRDLGQSRAAPWLERRAIRRTPRFVSNSPAGAQYLTRTLGVAPERIHVVPNGVELAPPCHSRAAWRSRLGLDSGTFVVCMVANLTGSKDHPTLLKAWRIALDRLQTRQPNALLLAGYFGNRHASLQSLVEELQIGPSVHFLGAVDDISGLLSAADLGILSSRSEGSPNGVLECMAAGLPVAGTDIAGIRDAVGPSGYRFLAPAGDVPALADRIVEFGADPVLRAAAGEANRLRVDREFSPRRMGERTVDILLEALSPMPR